MGKFQNVWFRQITPHRSMRALDELDIGTLSFKEKSILFVGEKGTFATDKIVGVKYDREGNDFVNHWIRIDFDDEDGNPRSAFCKDGTWRGWKSFLTKSDLPIFEALQQAIRV
jgi:hypothetical protein